MNSLRYIIKSLLYRKRINLAVILGVAAATAVLTGALLVGSSMRQSLRTITLDRLGKIDEVLFGQLFFREKLAEELSANKEFQDNNYSLATPIIFFPSSTVEYKDEKDGGKVKRNTRVSLIGCRPDFWKLGDEGLVTQTEIQSDQIIINQELATELGIDKESVGAGTAIVTLRVPKQQAVSSDSFIGKKDDVIESVTDLTVIEIVPSKSIGRFGLQPTQILPSNAFVSIEVLQDVLEQPEMANAILIAGKSPTTPPNEENSSNLMDALSPTLADYGLLIKEAKQEFEGDVVFDYYTLSSKQLLLPTDIDKVIDASFDESRRTVLTYLANDIDVVSQGAPKTEEPDGIPFSMVTGIDFGNGFQLNDADGNVISKLESGEILLNTWAAADINAKVGDTIRLEYFEPDTTHGDTVESFRDFTLKAIVPITKPKREFRRARQAIFDQLPTRANDPDMTPFVPGLTDRESIENWDLPFPTAHRIRREKDDGYWKNYRTTPKAFVTLEDGREMWQSRFGQTTSYQFDASKISREQLESQLLKGIKKQKAELGIVLQSVKRNGIRSSSGSTPFDALFLGLSLFIICSAILLVVLLFRLGLEQRASELGVLSATGIPHKTSSKLLIGEATIVSLIGGLIGIVIGVGYAYLMLVGLKTVWVQAIVNPFLTLYISPLALGIGLVSSVLICALTISISIYRTRRASVRSQLSGQLSPPVLKETQFGSWRYVVPMILIVVAIGTSILGTTLGGEAQAGAFVGSGFVLLSAMLMLVWASFMAQSKQESKSGHKLNELVVALRNAGRKPSRSALTIGLVAIAAFLVVSISAFRLAPTEEGTGGFQWIGLSNRPIFAKLDDSQAILDLIDEPEKLQIDKSLSFRRRPGADASCNNPYKVSNPTVLGVADETIEFYDTNPKKKFGWAGSTAISDEEKLNPWRLLKSDEPRSDDEPIPVIIDKNTAMYSLQIYYVGAEITIDFEEAPSTKLKVVGFLNNSILQGNLLVGEADFKRLFPQRSGYQFFLIDSAKNPKVNQQLEDELSDYGMDIQSSQTRLESLLAVQNTYLSAFQSLGSLGLLFGTFGLITVQLRNVFERRKELAVLSAIGLSNSRLSKIVLWEHAVLLVGGLFVGILSALFAVFPHMIFGNASIPILTLLGVMLLILVIGIVTGMIAVKAMLRTPLLGSLRSE